MNIAHTVEEIRVKHEGGHDLQREEISTLFEEIRDLNAICQGLEEDLDDLRHGDGQ